MLQLSDLIMIERGGTIYRTTGQDLINFITDSVGTSQYLEADIAGRDALGSSGDLTFGDRVEVTDASGDATVTAGWAIYSWTGAGFKKVAEEEGLDVIVGSSDLGFVRTASNFTITNTNGLDATVAAANATEAGAMTAADFVKLGLITLTSVVNLDTLANASHAEVTTQGTALTNPIAVSGQELSFSISGLSSAP